MNRILNMKASDVYQLLVAKAERKGKRKEDVDSLCSALLGYTEKEIEDMLSSDISYKDFFLNARRADDAYLSIRGKICAVALEDIKNPIERKIRVFDKMVDMLSKGKNINDIKKMLEGGKDA